DYNALALRAFDEPADDELREALRVCADALEQAGDPRGPLITMEHALVGAPLRRTGRAASGAAPGGDAVALRRAIHEHGGAHGETLLGTVASLLSYKRAVALEWRAGRIFGATIDTRYLAPKAHISPADIVKVFLRGPGATYLRRLRIRVRSRTQVAAVVEM